MTTENSTSNTNERLDRIERNLEKLIAIQALNAAKQSEAPRGSVDHSVIADLMNNPIFSGDLSALELASKPIDDKWDQVFNQCHAGVQILKFVQVMAVNGESLGPVPSKVVSMSDQFAIKGFKPLFDYFEETLNKVASDYSEPSHADLLDIAQHMSKLFSKSF